MTSVSQCNQIELFKYIENLLKDKYFLLDIHVLHYIYCIYVYMMIRVLLSI